MKTKNEIFNYDKLFTVEEEVNDTYSTMIITNNKKEVKTRETCAFG